MKMPDIYTERASSTLSAMSNKMSSALRASMMHIITAAACYCHNTVLFEFPNVPAAAMTRMIRNPKLVDGIGGFKIEREHPLQPFGSGVAIRGYDTQIYARPHQLRMFYADDSTTTSFVCMKQDGTPLIFLNFTVAQLQHDGSVVQVATTFTRSPQWLAQTLRPLFKFIGAIATKRNL
jgi:hypothetical protein